MCVVFHCDFRGTKFLGKSKDIFGDLFQNSKFLTCAHCREPFPPYSVFSPSISTFSPISSVYDCVCMCAQDDFQMWTVLTKLVSYAYIQKISANMHVAKDAYKAKCGYCPFVSLFSFFF